MKLERPLQGVDIELAPGNLQCGYNLQIRLQHTLDPSVHTRVMVLDKRIREMKHRHPITLFQPSLTLENRKAVGSELANQPE